MRIFHQRPTAELGPFIDRLWGWEAESPEVVALPTLLPGTGAELYFHYGTPFRIGKADAPPLSVAEGHLFSVRKSPIALQPTAGIGFIAVRFRISTLKRFTPIPAQELVDCQLCVSDIWGASGAALTRRLSYASSRAQRIALIEAFLLSHLQAESEDLLVERAMSALYRQGPAFSVEDLAHCLHLGRRQLERRWKRFTGQSPSEARGLIRFQKTVRSLMLDPATPIVAKALDHGYFDQAHFIHDFQGRVGMAPLQYLGAARSKTHFYNTPLPQAGNLATPIN